ncbi:uncharacterized protein LOC111913346 [Lactuca sativa]|uniref:uncharacterized protein LOC111913346 n=1 Tax=Lactuca sativa TaxID=4236 RepID=UPI0022AF8EA5|nr:uncharacterized protein LOC111913346 [Lactuca sativa]
MLPVAFKGATKDWLKALPPGAVTTWARMRELFLEQFCPPSKVAKLKKVITNFEQQLEESLYEAWERYKGLIGNCPQNDLNVQQEVSIFYDGVNVTTRQLLDSQGPLTKKNLAEIKQLIEDFSKHSREYHNPRNDVTRGSANAASEDMSAMKMETGRSKLATQVARLDEDWKKPKKKKWLPYDEYKKAKEEKHEVTEAAIKEQQLAIKEQQLMMKEQQEMMKNQQALLRNQQASILNIDKQLGQLATQFNERAPGGLPGNTEQNPRGAHIQAIATRSGKIITHLTPIDRNEPEAEQEGQEENKDNKSGRSPRRGGSATAWQDSEEKNTKPAKTYRPPLAFPSRAIQEKHVEDYRKFLDHIKSLEINIPFLEALVEMPKYAKFLKDLLTNRKKMEGLSKVVLNETCSAAMLNMLPKKMGDPESITLPCQFGNLATSHALADSGASVNLMLYSFFKKLDLPELRPVRMVIHLANKTMTFPRGICEDLLVKVNKFLFPTDFIVLDIEEDEQVPIILGRPFLSNTRDLVDIREYKLTLRVGEEVVTFGVNQAIKHSRMSDDTAFSVDVLDEILEKESVGWKEKENEGFMVLDEGNFDPEFDLQELEKLLEEGEYNEAMQETEDTTRRGKSATTWQSFFFSIWN